MYSTVPWSSPWHCQCSQSMTAHWLLLSGSPASPSLTAHKHSIHSWQTHTVKLYNSAECHTTSIWLKCIDCLWFSLLLLLYIFRDFYDASGTWEAKEKMKKRNCLMVAVTSSSLRALSHSFWPGACWVHMVMSWLIVSVTALQRQMIRQISG